MVILCIKLKDYFFTLLDEDYHLESENYNFEDDSSYNSEIQTEKNQENLTIFDSTGLKVELDDDYYLDNGNFGDVIFKLGVSGLPIGLEM